jgi:nucleoside diphosphate kinase
LDVDLPVKQAFHILHEQVGICKALNVERSFAETHYADFSAKHFFKGLVDYIISNLVVAMIWEGKNVVTTGRKIIISKLLFSFYNFS